MADLKDIYQTLENDPELSRSLMSMATGGFSPKQISDAMAAAGLEVELEQVEEMLQNLQKRQAEDIVSEDLDLDQLDKVSGGGTGTSCQYPGDCDKHFKEAVFYDSNPDYDKRCGFTVFCDEYYSTGDPTTFS